jgi:hypothetical protein
MRQTLLSAAALLGGAILGALAMLLWMGNGAAPLPPGTEVRFEIEEPNWTWWPASAPRCPPLITTTPSPTRPL